jgi:hypothetical protein
MAEVKIDFSRSSITVQIAPESKWTPPELVISDSGDEVRIQLTSEDLKEIAEAIQEHLGLTKSEKSA